MRKSRKPPTITEDWSLWLVPSGATPYELGRFATREDAQEAADEQDARLVWEPPSQMFHGWIALGAHGVWLLESRVEVDVVMRHPLTFRTMRQRRNTRAAHAAPTSDGVDANEELADVGAGAEGGDDG